MRRKTLPKLSYSFSYQLGGEGYNPLFDSGIEVKVVCENERYFTRFRIEAFIDKYKATTIAPTFVDEITTDNRVKNEIIEVSKHVVFEYLEKERGFPRPRNPQEAEKFSQEGYGEKVEGIKRMIEEKVMESEGLKWLCPSLYGTKKFKK
jgi:hypothetical protein